MASIFISYRRSDAGGHARALHDYLSGRFDAEHIFFDRSKIESGDDFPERLRQSVEGCAVLLALIGPDWLDATSAGGSRRLDDPGDFVRQEIALALDRGKRVIPVLFDDTPVPPPHRLPDALKALARRDALTLRGKTFEYRIQRDELVRLLATVPGVPQPFAEAGEAIADKKDRRTVAGHYRGCHPRLAADQRDAAGNHPHAGTTAWRQPGAAPNLLPDHR